VRSYEIRRRRVGSEGVLSGLTPPHELGRLELLPGRVTTDAILTVSGSVTGSATPSLTFAAQTSDDGSAWTIIGDTLTINVANATDAAQNLKTALPPFRARYLRVAVTAQAGTGPGAAHLDVVITLARSRALVQS
jgi:hypothetical protein